MGGGVFMPRRLLGIEMLGSCLTPPHNLQL